MGSVQRCSRGAKSATGADHQKGQGLKRMRWDRSKRVASVFPSYGQPERIETLRTPSGLAQPCIPKGHRARCPRNAE